MKKNNAKFNGILPEYVFDFEDGEYICEIDGFSVSEHDSDKLVVKICCIEEEVPNMVFRVYYDLTGASLCKTSQLGRLLKELGLIRKNKIQWKEFTGQQVLAEIVTSKAGNVYVKKLSAIPEDMKEVFEEELEFDEDE